MTRRPPSSTLFPYTTLFRSVSTISPSKSSVPTAIISAFTVSEPQGRGDRKSTRLSSIHCYTSYSLFFFNDPAPTELYPLPLHDALPICIHNLPQQKLGPNGDNLSLHSLRAPGPGRSEEHTSELHSLLHLLFPLFF